MQVCRGGISRSHSVDMLCKFTSFLKSSHWLVDTRDMGHFGVSYLEILILFESWMGYRLLGEKRSLGLSYVLIAPFYFLQHLSEGIECRQGRQFISGLFRALGKLIGGLGRFISRGHMSRLRDLGWQ